MIRVKKVEKTSYYTNLFSLECGALIAIGIVLLQDLVSSSSLDLPLTITSFAFAVAIPMLSAKLLINFEESKAGYYVPSKRVKVLYWGGLLSAFIGVNAAFWHISLIVGGVFSVSALISLVLYVSYVSDAQLNSTEVEEALKHGIRRVQWGYRQKQETAPTDGIKS